MSVDECLGDDVMHMIRPWQSLDLSLIGNSWGIFLFVLQTVWHQHKQGTNYWKTDANPRSRSTEDGDRPTSWRCCWFWDFYFQHTVMYARLSYTRADISHVLLGEEEENMHQKKMSNQNTTLQVVFFYGQYKWLISWIVEIISSRPDVSPTELCVSVFRRDGCWAHQRSNFTTAKSCLTELWFR